MGEEAEVRVLAPWWGAGLVHSCEIFLDALLYLLECVVEGEGVERFGLIVVVVLLLVLVFAHPRVEVCRALFVFVDAQLSWWSRSLWWSWSAPAGWLPACRWPELCLIGSSPEWWRWAWAAGLLWAGAAGRFSLGWLLARGRGRSDRLDVFGRSFRVDDLGDVTALR